ncbi:MULTISPECIES: UDP-N-acetylmuramate--L-alanine ligase [unclassified Campylobacter]|uniref:UDP-N-acetylmuramate--L-alanine ligase n=1 Tax=unclassified Campylobacter TaxID=2593542 RepID=UPI001BDA049A|nr:MULTISPECIES: UDP-N-acetylmuramate--L-alanine ligase [unclassified Campylobacter]MBZ7975532.1 UDP-N-acetylmuramate--L-alanine ligase [Campylobacter sp. RM12637]MBZ7978566.1 UDP-N-acetylmuramate--L-alanine ligase [Campylobacter sp. RM12654]MBZ7981067.1 UDP-N-acetylmuramate--L-alanine ligase [Campylobacter sp. RM12640]MBZ7988386.1 UDP-N-acetylmuramate--L-alanine ligase [Campylobacter sp. RM12635]MBT0879905.1 UDP-N-acetylmuramate--L-alanine ligase [Campylobacter sp. 2018MI27]
MKKIFFIGIGGIGLSALARFLNERGISVLGSDVYESELVKELRAEGIAVFIGHSASNLSNDIDLVVHSAVIRENNPEIKKAKELGIKVLSRKEALPLILENKMLFAVAGAHGKSTTSSILANILQSSFIIGAVDKRAGKNMVYKTSEKLVFEADESDSSFLNLNPALSIVTNAEPEHLEHYNHDLNAFYKAYTDFLKQSKIRVINAEDEFLATIDLDCERLVPSEDIKNLEFEVKDYLPFISFDLRDFGRFSVQGHSECIAIDTALAILAARCVGLSLSEIKQNLKDFCGIKKRFDVLYASKDFVIIDDYAHHPTEVRETKKGIFSYAKALNLDDTIAIWQPHKYTRLLDNLEGFKTCFEGFSKLFILPVYSANEDEIKIDLAKHFPNACFIDDIKRVDNSLKLFSNLGEITLDKGVVVGFNAGDLTYKLRGLK